MPSRRISSVPALAPVQEIAVNPFSAYNSDNVNMLTRTVTGQKNKDVIVNGLDLKGINTVLSEVLDDTPFISDFFNYVGSSSSLLANWGSPVNFDTTSNSLIAYIPSGTYATATIQSELIPNSEDIGFWFKVQFSLSNVPKTLYFIFGSETKVYDHPAAGNYLFYIQLYNNSGTFENFKIVAQLDSSDTTSNVTATIDNLIVTKVWNKATEIQPISLPEANSPDTYNEVQLNHTNIQTQLLHPHTQLNIYPGIAVKDEAVITITGTNTDQPALVLTYNDPDCWIKGSPFTVADFPEGTVTKYVTDGDLTEYSASFDSSGELTGVTLSDDGFVSSPYYTKISGNSNSGHAYVKWAYVVMYYSYFKNPLPNNSYIGLAKEEEISDGVYGEDYLILGKLRFVDVNTVDAIIYYPDRPDLAYIDATRVTYLHLNQLKHWLNKPVNVSLALDSLASRIYNWKGVLYFNTHAEFVDWIDRVHGSATGHGPADFQQWIDGMDPQNGYDLLAFIVETNSFFKSKINTYEDRYVVTVQWDEISLHQFEINWSGLPLTNGWPTSIPSNWSWVGGGTQAATLQAAKLAWPLKYYKTAGTGAGASYSIVNPYNSTGRGNVPGPTSVEVGQNKFLRADGTWQFAGSGPISFFIQGFLVGSASVPVILGETLVTEPKLINTMTVSVGTLPVGDNIVIKLYKKVYTGPGWGAETELESVTITAGSNFKESQTFSPAVLISKTDHEMLVIKCEGTGVTPDEGGSDTIVTVHYQ